MRLRPWRGVLRPVCQTAHRWLGLTLGVYFLLQGLSGSLLVFAQPIDERLHPEVHFVSPSGAPLTADQVVARVEAAFPNESIDRAVPPKAPDRTWLFRLGPWGGDMREVFVDPYRGAIVGDRHLTDTPVGFLRYFHYNLLLGDPGWIANGYAGATTAALLLTGLVLWWPRTLKQAWVRLTIKRDAGAKRWIHDLHNIVGVYTLPVLLVAAITGMAFVLYVPAERVVFAITRTPPAPPAPEVVPPSNPAPRPLPLEALISEVAASAPGEIIERVVPPRAPERPLLVLTQRPGDDRLGIYRTWLLDPYRGTVLRVTDGATQPLGRRIMALNFPVHTGLWGGPGVQALYVLFGLAPLALFVTGLLKWLARRRGQARNRRRHQAAPDRDIARPRAAAGAAREAEKPSAA